MYYIMITLGSTFFGIPTGMTNYHVLASTYMDVSMGVDWFHVLNVNV